MISTDDRIRTYIRKARDIHDLVEDLGPRVLATKQSMSHSFAISLALASGAIDAIGMTLAGWLMDGPPSEETALDEISDELDRFDRLSIEYRIAVEALERATKILEGKG